MAKAKKITPKKKPTRQNRIDSAVNKASGKKPVKRYQRNK
jgi:hypothetical protein